jgi:hypothetical protein
MPWLENGERRRIKDAIMRWRHLAFLAGRELAVANQCIATYDAEHQRLGIGKPRDAAAARHKLMQHALPDEAKSDPIYYFLRDQGSEWFAMHMSALTNIVKDVFEAKDPEKNARRTFLTLNGARRFPAFARLGIRVHKKYTAYRDRALEIRLWPDADPIVMDVGRLDANTWYWWRMARDEPERRGELTINLNRKGRVVVSLPVRRDVAVAPLDPQTVASVVIAEDQPQNVLEVNITEGRRRWHQGIPPLIVDALAAQEELRAARGRENRLARLHASARSTKHGKAAKHWGQARQRNSAASQRTRRKWAHTLARRIVDWCAQQRIGTLIAPKEWPETLDGISFPWSSLCTQVRGKPTGLLVEKAELIGLQIRCGP